MLSLGLLLPLGTGTVTDGAANAMTQLASPAKHVTLVRDGTTQHLTTHAATADGVLSENGIVRTADDALDVDPQSAVTDGETLRFQTAVPVTIVVDRDAPRLVRFPVATVRDALSRAGVSFDRHDRVSPAPSAAVPSAGTIRVLHVNAWTERRQTAIAPPTVKRLAFGISRGRTRVLDAGSAGIRVTDYAVFRTPDRRGVRKTTLASRILRRPRSRIVAEGIGDFAALGAVAQRGIDKTLVMATQALSMIATAYTADCAGCSGTTAVGRRAGHGVVAVDPRVIPLGSHVYIPGYGRAIAGDTGGAIHGKRIDLGFDSSSDALSFGRRTITVYLVR